MPTAGWVRLSVATKKAGGTTAATVVAGTGNGTDATVVEVAEACQVAAWAGAGEKTLAVRAARGGRVASRGARTTPAPGVGSQRKVRRHPRRVEGGVLGKMAGERGGGSCCGRESGRPS